MTKSQLIPVMAVGISILTLAIYSYGVWRPVKRGKLPSVNETKRSRTASAGSEAETFSASEATRRSQRPPRRIGSGNLNFWWDAVPATVRETAFASGPQSNMHRDDYAGATSCQRCHPQNYDKWLRHPHSRMNALAVEKNVLGRFDQSQSIGYRGGRAEFYRDGDEFRMRLTRDETTIVYHIRETIGSRFFQYYIGRMINGPYPATHPYFQVNHVLPFGYWLSRETWVPVVHVGRELPDNEREDPFAPPLVPTPGLNFTPYASNCNMCHTTFPMGDELTRKPHQVAKHAPFVLHWSMAAYFQSQHPDMWGNLGNPEDVPTESIDYIPLRLMEHEGAEHAVAMGIACEACHLGSREHVANPRVPPDFHPHSPFLFVETNHDELQLGRNHQNVNWACGRCHTGERPTFAAGMSTWNSVEYSDAMLGSCYSEMTCVTCHNPHEAMGTQWARTRDEDNALCTQCHKQFGTAEAIRQHTHHDVDSEGASCMNCHMPRINEGLEAVVRTHMIYSPTDASMIESNHPNACNLCHTDRSIDWTTEHLTQWYGAKFSEDKISLSYSNRTEAVARGWMNSDNEAVRLVGADAACRANDRSLLPSILRILDDPYLLNRQFAAMGIERLLGIQLDEYGYSFYMSSAERQAPLKQLREQFLDAK